jgi:gliding motility-associated-like protein
VDASAIKTVKDDNLGEVVVITITEKSMFRLAALNAFGNNTELYSSTEQAQFYEVKTLTLTADPAKIKKDSGAKLTLAYENLDATTAAQWFVVKGDNDEEFTPSSSTEHIIASLSETTTYKVIWDFCDATATVNVIQPASVAFMSRDCNEITMQATVDDTYGDFFWETSKDGIEWETLAGKENQTSINVTITETTYFRVNNALDMPSDASYANEVHSITLEVDKEEIKRDEQVTLTATADFSSNFDIKWYQNGEVIENTTNPYSPTLQTDATFYVELEGCESESVSINVIQPASVAFVSRECNEITLKATVEEGVSYKWQKSKDGNSWTDMSETGSPITVTITENTKFRVKTDDVESEPTDIIELWGVILTIDKESIILGEEVTISAVTDNSSEDIIWFENNEEIDNSGNSYTVKPLSGATYKVTQGGCPSNEVTLNSVVWPTVFTPMLVDGFNDDFLIGMSPAIALKIYDRYGNLIIETTDGWDGRYADGKYAMPNVYYYVATLPNGEIVKGNVELLDEKLK